MPLRVVLPIAKSDGDQGPDNELGFVDSTGSVSVDNLYPGTHPAYPGSSYLSDNSSLPLYFQHLGNLASDVVFEANDGTHGRELWITDGTAAGTTLLKDINAGSGDAFTSLASYPGSAMSQPFNGAVFFSASDGGDGAELWKTDGTAAGTVLVDDINPGSGSSAPSSFTVAGSNLFFTAFDGAHGVELWKTNGTAGGTQLVIDIKTVYAYYSTGSNPTNLMAVGSELYFAADDGTNGYELWKSDGTSIGTVMVKDINTTTAGASEADNSSSPISLTAVGSELYFVATDGTHGSELWKSDGSSAGTVLVKDIMSGSAGSTIRDMVNLNGQLLFFADDGVHGYELWKSDGTNAGTSMVTDINPTETSTGTASAGNPSAVDFTVADNMAFFVATNGINGNELWETDGTASGTKMVANLNMYGSSAPEVLTAAGGYLYFTAFDGVNGGASTYSLYKTDGATTTLVSAHNYASGNGFNNFAVIGVPPVSDFGNDGYSDILLQKAGTGEAAIWSMNGATINAQVKLPGTSGAGLQGVAVGDFNGDGRADILWQNTSTGQASVWFMNGSTELAGSGAAGSARGAAYRVLGTGDFNGDGKADIVWENSSTGQVSVWLMNGTTELAGANVGAAFSTDWSFVGTGDFDGDGKADIVFQNATTGAVKIWLMNGTTKVGGGTLAGTSGAGHEIVGIGDFNGDGKSDLLWETTSTTAMSIWFMNGMTRTSHGSIGDATSGRVVAGVADYNGDGMADILLQTTSSGHLTEWLMDGTTKLSGGGSLSSNPGSTWHVVAG